MRTRKNNNERAVDDVSVDETSHDDEPEDDDSGSDSEADHDSDEELDADFLDEDDDSDEEDDDANDDDDDANDDVDDDEVADADDDTVADAVADVDNDSVADEDVNVDVNKKKVEAFMIDIENGLKSITSKEYCAGIRGEPGSAKYLSRVVTKYFVQIKADKALISDSLDFTDIEDKVGRLLQDKTARNGLSNMTDSVVLAIDAFRYCSVDLFSTPEVKLNLKEPCCITKSLQRLSCK